PSERASEASARPDAQHPCVAKCETGCGGAITSYQLPAIDAAEIGDLGEAVVHEGVLGVLSPAAAAAKHDDRLGLVAGLGLEHLIDAAADLVVVDQHGVGQMLLRVFLWGADIEQQRALFLDELVSELGVSVRQCHGRTIYCFAGPAEGGAKPAEARS